MNKEKTLEDVLKLTKKQHVAMLASLDAGRPVSRPMGVMQPDDDATFWFFTLADSDVVTQLQAGDRVNVSFADGDYLSVTGNAELVQDAVRARELWNPAVEAWMGDLEPEDPKVRLIKVTAESIAYWDTPGTVGSVVGMVGGLIGNKRPDVGEHGVVDA